MKNLCILLILFAGTALFAGDIVIAENGQAQADIVIPEQPSAYVSFAAKELKVYLDKITGADFKITSKPSSQVRINLGQSKAAATAGLNPETLKHDGFFISAKDKDIFIVGVDNTSVKKINFFHLFYDESQRATLLGVYEFLEQLGVRWPAPGSGHEFVPKSGTLKIPEGTQKIEPFFQDRQLRGFWDFYRGKFPDAKEYCGKLKEVYLWGLRLKLSGRGMVPGCHSERKLELKKAYGDHPERFALIDGERNFNYSCWTDPAVAAMWKKAADVYFSGGKPAEAGFPDLKPYYASLWPWPFISKNDFMIDPMDHNSRCDGRCRCSRCEEFRKKYPCSDDSEIMWKVIVEVAKFIHDKHPGKFISTLMYPPKMKLPEYVKIPNNVRIRICGRGPKDISIPKRLKSFLNLVQRWGKVLGNNKPPLWTYQCEMLSKLPGPPETYPHLISEFLKIFSNNIAGMYFEQHALSQTYRNLDMYITAKMLWDPSCDIDKELTDYFKSYYGPAAQPAQKLFERFEKNWIKYCTLANSVEREENALGITSPAKTLQRLVWSEVYTRDEMRKIDAMIAAAEKAATINPVYLKRVRLLRKWIFDIMKMYRAEVMNKKEKRQKIIAQVTTIKTIPVASDWSTAPIYSLIPANRFKKSLRAATQFQLVSNENTLYLRAKLEEPRLAASLTKKNRNNGDSKVWQDNDLEIFLYSTKTKDLWQIIVNDQGVWSSQRINAESAKWLQLDKFKVKVYPVANGWVVEAVIPLEKFKNGEILFNLTRNRQIKGLPGELSTWSPLAMVGNWHSPENYGTLVFSVTNN